LTLTDVTFGRDLKTVGNTVFAFCRKLEKVTLQTSEVNFGTEVFAASNPIMAQADKFGYLLEKIGVSTGEGVPAYRMWQFIANKQRRYILLAHLRFCRIVHEHPGSAEAKVGAAMKDRYPVGDGGGIRVAEFFKCCIEGRGARGVLSEILRWL